MVTKKTTAKKAPAATPSTELQAYAIDGITKGMTTSQNMAVLATRSTLAAFTVKAYSGVAKDTDEADIITELQKAGNEVVGGDMGRVEKMLVNQAIILDNIFNNMAQRSAKQDTFKGIEVLLRLGLKAQAQARSTAEALALLKNPMPYIKQANMTTGPQQVNNTYAGTPSHSGIQSGGTLEHSARAQAGAGNSQSEPNKLLEAQHGNTLDFGAQAAAGRADQTLEAVGAVHRPQDA